MNNTLRYKISITPSSFTKCKLIWTCGRRNHFIGSR